MNFFNESDVARKLCRFLVIIEKPIRMWSHIRKEFIDSDSYEVLNVTYTHAIFIDESGNGAPISHINRLWITSAVALPFEKCVAFESDIERIKASYFRPGVLEIKGAKMSQNLMPGVSMDPVIQDLSQALERNEAHIWVVGTQFGVNIPPGFPIPSPMPKDIVRQLLLERVNGFLLAGYEGVGEFMLIWDISDQQELQDFSRNIAAFQDSYSGADRSTRMIPALLGGLSHDWPGLQAADVIANFAMHKVGNQMNLIGVHPDKAVLFDRYLYPLLQKDGSGRREGIGWKIW